jgi:hypothetical protein
MVWVHPKTAETDSSTTGALVGAGSLRISLTGTGYMGVCLCGPVGNGFLLPAQHLVCAESTVSYY